MTTITPEQAKANALVRFADTGPDHINCAQAVVAFALQVMGHDPKLEMAARYLGGGVARTGEACGAVTGAALSLGLRDYHLAGDDRELPGSRADELLALLRGFAGEFACLRCRDLTGYDVSTPEGFEAFKTSEAHERCPVYVGWVCDHLAPLLLEQANPAPGAE